MAAATTMQLELLPGARALLAMHARELPQRDDLCGAFCGALALRRRSPLGSGLIIAKHRLGRREREALRAGPLPIEIPVTVEAR